METLLNGLLIWVIWYIIGCIALSAIDDKEERLFKWVKECPLPFGYLLTVTAWPIILLVWYKYNVHRG